MPALVCAFAPFKLSYNQENFLTSVGSTVSYVYDAQGRRVRKTVSGTVTEYFYSGAVVVSEKQGSNWTDYIFPSSALGTGFGGQRIVKQTGSSLSTATFIHTDHLNSTRVCTASSGNSTGSCNYEPFGEYQGGSCSLPVNYRYAGMEWDSETQLYHTWFRQYDISQGRWMSVDPLAGSADDPQSANRYVYVLNDPVDLLDPYGLQSAWNCGWAHVPGGGFEPRICVTVTNDPAVVHVRPGPSLVGLNIGSFGTNSGTGVPGMLLDTGTETEPTGGSILERIAEFGRGIVCGITEPLQRSAYLNQGAVGVGFGGAAGMGIVVVGVQVQISIQLVADPKGNVGIAFTGGGNPGYGVAGFGAIGGVQFMNSDARSITDLRGLAWGAGGSGAIGGVGVGLDYAGSGTTNSVTATVGLGKGGRTGAYAVLGTAIPSTLSVSCR